MYTVIRNIKYCEHGLLNDSKGMCKIKIATNAYAILLFSFFDSFSMFNNFWF